MKITYIAPSRIPSLTANSMQVMKVCQALTQLGHEVLLLVPGTGSRAWSELTEVYGVQSPFQIDWLPARRALHKLDFARAAVGHARRAHTDVIYTRLLWVAIFALRQKVPVILEMHEVPSGNFAPRLYHHYLALRGQRLTVFITRALQSEVEQKLAVRHVAAEAFVAPDGVDLERYQNLPAPVEARQALDLPAGLTAAYSGGFYPGRGLERLFDLAAAFPQVHFLWIGGQPQVVAEWRARVQAQGLTNVTLTGFVPNQQLPLYQAAADVLVMPYRQKVAGSSGGDIARVTSPMKLFEYMASGRAILCSDLPVLHEVLDDSTACFYPPDDFAAMTAAFTRLIEEDSLRANLAAHARQEVARYSWKNRMHTILDFFSKNSLENKE